MNPAQFARLKSRKQKADALVAIRSALAAHVRGDRPLKDLVEKAFVDIEKWLSQPNGFVTVAQARTVSRHGLFTCHCGRPATKVNALVGRCDTHANGLRGRATKYIDSRAAEVESAQRAAPSPRSVPNTHEGGQRFRSTLGRSQYEALRVK